MGILAATVVVAAGSTGAAPAPERRFTAAQLCPAFVGGIVAVGAGAEERGPATRFGLVLASREVQPLRTYRVVLADDEHAFQVDVPVAIDRPAAKGMLGFDAAPVFVTFARPVVVHDAWVGRIASDDDEATCGVNNVLTDRLPLVAPLRLRDAAETAAAVTAADAAGGATVVAVREDAAAALPAVSCAIAEQRGRMTTYAPLRAAAPSGLAFPTGSSAYVVSLDADGSVLDVRILRSDLGASWTALTRNRLALSTFRPTVHRCVRVPGDIVVALSQSTRYIRR